jgi:hypothetical protein
MTLLLDVKGTAVFVRRQRAGGPTDAGDQTFSTSTMVLPSAAGLSAT